MLVVLLVKFVIVDVCIPIVYIIIFIVRANILTITTLILEYLVVSIFVYWTIVPVWLLLFLIISIFVVVGSVVASINLVPVCATHLILTHICIIIVYLIFLLLCLSVLL
jgi:hypothetical protein